MVSCDDLQAWIGKELNLAEPGHPHVGHLVSDASIHALMAALQTGRPLLVKGEPGVGKSQLAHAAAKMLNRHLLVEVVQPRAEYQDLLWTFDHAGRLGQAQLLGALIHRDESAAQALFNERLKPELFLSPGPLWWAFSWNTALRFSCRVGYMPRPTPGMQAPERGIVLLLDEIDKADIDVPNGLLEVMGTGGFSVPFLEGRIVADNPPPLVIVTSNDMRELPGAFLRRCVVLELSLPKEQPRFIDHLVRIGKSHYPEMEEGVLRKAAELLWADRGNSRRSDIQVGQAEYVDLLRALAAWKTTEEQDRCMTLIGPYVFGKHGGASDESDALA